MRPFAATLDSAIKEAVEAQLDASMSAMTFVRFVDIGAGFQATTISVSVLAVQSPDPSGPDVSVTWWGGAITASWCRRRSTRSARSRRDAWSVSARSRG